MAKNGESQIVKPSVDQGFVRLVLGAAIAIFVLIIIGAITRVSGSGMGCGTDWPACNGAIVPEFKNVAVVIEFGHRVFAVLIGLFSLAVLVQAVRRHRHEPRLLIPAVIGFALFFVQSGLGAITVKLSNQWVSVLLHLGDSMFMLAAYIVLWVNARSADNTESANSRPSLTLVEVLLATLLAFTVAMIGAAVQGNGATKACVGWPLCAGQVWPVDQGPFQVLNMVHRLVAGALGIAILYMIWRAWQTARPVLRVSLAAALIIYVLQAAIGAAVVLLNNQIWFVIAQSLHVTFAAATWSTMVTVSAIVWLQQQSSRPAISKTKRVEVSSATISN